MNANPNDARFFMTLCNFLKKSEIKYEISESKTIEYYEKEYTITSQQFGIVEHSKENLMTAFEQIIELLSGDHEKIFLYKFFFDIIDETSGIGQYTLQYCIIEKEDIEETEFVEEIVVKEEPFNEYIENNYSESSEYSDDEIVNEEQEDSPETNDFIPKNVIEEIKDSPDVVYDHKKENVLFNNGSDKNPIPTSNYANLFGIENDIDYLIKLLVKNIHPEVSELISKAILIVIKNRLDIPA